MHPFLTNSTSNRDAKQMRKNVSMNFVEQFDRPSSKLFTDFCDDVVKNYSLNDILVKGFVTRIEPCLDKDGNVSVYRLHLQGDDFVETKKVIIATGQSRKRFPKWVRQIQFFFFD